MNKTKGLTKIKPTIKRKYHTDYIIEVIDSEGNVGYASDQVTLALHLGVSKTMISNVLNPRYEHFKTVRGCKLRYVDIKELALNGGEL